MKNAIDTVERLLCERYNVRSLDGLGALPGAIEAARGGDLGPLRSALEGRDLYQWRRGIEAALAEAESGKDGEPDPEPEPEPEPEAETATEAAEAPEASEEPPVQGADEDKPKRTRKGA